LNVKALCGPPVETKAVLDANWTLNSTTFALFCVTVTVPRLPLPIEGSEMTFRYDVKLAARAGNMNAKHMNANAILGLSLIMTVPFQAV
jgi:hypothetical protein